MALLKSIESAAGITAAYWRVTTSTKDYNARTCWFAMEGYIDEAARTAKKEPVPSQTKPFTMNVPKDLDMDSIGRAEMYEFAKLNDAFEGATDK